MAAAALGLVVGGCGESRQQAASTATSASPPPTAARPATADVTVTEREYSLTPPNLQARRTGTFTISARNAGGIPHALEIEGPGGTVKTGAIAPGQTAQLTIALSRPGRYRWYCPLADHRSRGMRGTVVVAGGGATKPKTSGGGSYPG